MNNKHVDNQQLVLWKAIEDQNIGLVKQILENGFNLHSDQYDFLPFAIHLDSLTRVGNGEIVLLLLNHGALINQLDKQGYTPLYYASQKLSHALTRLLLENGANVNETDINGCTALHYSACDGSHAITKLLLDYGADTTIKDNSGATPLDEAYCWGSNSREDKEMIKLMEQIHTKQVAEKKANYNNNCGEF